MKTERLGHPKTLHSDFVHFTPVTPAAASSEDEHKVRAHGHSHKVQDEGLNQDAADLQKMGYVQELLRNMGGFSSFAMSFSTISILTGATQLYGYGFQHGGPLQMSLGWMLVSVFTLMVALSMAELASAFPTAGALYHWSSFLGGRTLGWVTACLNTLGQFAILAGIDFGLSQFLVQLFGVSSQVGIVLYLGILLSHTLLNLYAIRWVWFLNRFSAWYHMGVVALLFGALFQKGFIQPTSTLFKFQSSDSFSPSYSFLVGLLLAQWTLTGFDASAHATEETLDPRRNAPWGIFLAVILSVVFGEVMLASVTLSIPDLAQANAWGEGAFIEILKARLGPELGLGMVGLVAGAMWLCGLAALTSASRMVYAFARDGGFPASKFWAKIHPVYRTPGNAIWGLAFLATVLALSVNIYSAVVSVATIALYLSYGLPICARLYTRFAYPKRDTIGPWHLGRWSTAVAWISVSWIFFVSVLFVLPPNTQAGQVMGVVVFCLLAIWFGYARRRFRGPPALRF
jgi:amino acid transporter